MCLSAVAATHKSGDGTHSICFGVALPFILSFLVRYSVIINTNPILVFLCSFDFVLTPPVITKFQLRHHHRHHHHHRNPYKPTMTRPINEAGRPNYSKNLYKSLKLTTRMTSDQMLAKSYRLCSNLV